MTFPIIATILFFLIFFLIYRAISRNKIDQLTSLSSQKRSIKEKYSSSLKRRNELKNELAGKKDSLDLLLQPQKQKEINASPIKKIDPNKNKNHEKISRYLIQRGKITMEQNLKVLKKMETLQMDYLSVCMTLGFIDLDTTKQAIEMSSK